MNSNANHVTVAGNVTRDPELRFLANGTSTLELGVAVNRRWQNPANEEWEESTSFFAVVCWGDLAQHVAGSVGRGSRVVVTGRLEERRWESKGQKRSKIELVADDVALSLRFAIAAAVRPAGITSEQVDANPAA